MISGILLAGGKSKRMNENKAFIKFKGRYLFEFSISLLQKYADEILISTSNPEFKKTGHLIISDDYPDLGPMGGVFSSLNRSKNLYSLVLPCDLPLLSYEITNLLFRDFEQFDISVFLNENGLPEPLIGIYSKNVIPVIYEHINLGKLKMQEILKKVNTNYIQISQELFNAQPYIFRNINTRKDLMDLIRNYE